MKQMKIKTKLPVSIFREGDSFIAYTPALDISTSGKSYSEVKKRFSELVEIFLEEIIEAGNLNTVLLDLGWEKVKKQWMPSAMISQKIEDFEGETIGYIKEKGLKDPS